MNTYMCVCVYEDRKKSGRKIGMGEWTQNKIGNDANKKISFSFSLFQEKKYSEKKKTHTPSEMHNERQQEYTQLYVYTLKIVRIYKVRCIYMLFENTFFFSLIFPFLYLALFLLLHSVFFSVTDFFFSDGV